MCLIGNNGSGKTTLINILAGFANPEEGNITVGGESVLNNITAVRDSIRLCQQFDFLFDELTPMQHLKLASMLRGGLNQDQIDALAQGLGLEVHQRVG